MSFKSPSYKFAFILTLIILANFPPQVRAQEKAFEVSVSKYLMGTLVEATAIYKDIRACKQAFYHAFVEMERVENRLGYNETNSEISEINRNAGRAPVKVSTETFAILERAKSYARRLDGVFDVSIGVVTELWGFNTEREIKIPNKTVLDSLLRLVNYENIVLNSQDTTAYLVQKGMKIDLGGIAKGYAIDRGVQVLREQGIQNFLINAGGDIYVSGKKSANSPWNIGIKHPRKADALLAKFELNNFAVATSGDYERYAEINGKRYHHILNPKTGYPAGLCRSVSLLAATAEEADVLATYFFITGLLSDHIEYLEQFVLMDATGKVHFDSTLVISHKLSVFE